MNKMGSLFTSLLFVLFLFYSCESQNEEDLIQTKLDTILRRLDEQKSKQDTMDETLRSLKQTVEGQQEIIDSLQQCPCIDQIVDNHDLLATDECTNRSHNCSHLAICSETPESYKCTCLPGYSGDGFDCQDINECNDMNITCGVNEVCSNIPGSYECICPEGYKKEGNACQDTACESPSIYLVGLGCIKLITSKGIFTVEEGLGSTMSFEMARAMCKEQPGGKLLEDITVEHVELLSQHFNHLLPISMANLPADVRSAERKYLGSRRRRSSLALLGQQNVTVANQTAQLRSTALLHCHVQNMTDNTVSWIRRRDNHLLTFGLLKYTQDERFSVVKVQESNDWALQIMFIQEKDQGTYKCQVSTSTGSYEYLVNLKVAVPKAVISGSKEIHVKSGSTISLLCIIEGSLTPPQFIMWSHNNKMINYDISRGGISVSREDHVMTSSSRLFISNANFKDSGIYKCSPTNTKPSSVNVYVSEGLKPFIGVLRSKWISSGLPVDSNLWMDEEPDEGDAIYGFLDLEPNESGLRDGSLDGYALCQYPLY